MNKQHMEYRQIKQKVQDLLTKYAIEKPVVNIFEIAENEGINLEFVDMPKELENVAGFFDSESKSIFVNNADPLNRQTFTIAHELGHYILCHKTDEYGVLYRLQVFNGEVPAIEKEANCFAANLLVPENMLKKEMRRYNLNEKDDELLAKLFGVSKEMMRYRLKTACL